MCHIRRSVDNVLLRFGRRAILGRLRGSRDVTAGGAVIFLFAMDLLTGYYWQSEARSRLQFYFLLAVANAVVLIVWALYNKLRFQKQQHHAAYQYTPQEYAESLAIPDELYQQLQKSHRMSVHFTSQGQIKMVVSEKALVRA